MSPKGIPGKGGKQLKVTPEEIDEWKRLRKSGLSIAEVAVKVGRNVTTVALKTGEPGSTPPKITPEQISQARSMRASGSTLEEIVAATGIGHSAAHRYVKDIPKPRTEASISASVTQHERQRRRLLIDEKTNTTNYAVNDEDTPSEYLPEHLPATADGYDVSGLFPDPALLAEANGVGERLTHDLATGRIWESRPIEPVIAMYIVAHNFHIWSKDAFLADRNSWRRVREFSGTGAVELAERAGVSMSSISRYEKNQRTPDSGQIDQLWWAYRGCQIDIIERLELSLALDSAFEHYATEANVPLHEIIVEGEDLLRWVADQPIENLTHLARARSFLPRPDWRQEDPNFGFEGYAHDEGEGT